MPVRLKPKEIHPTRRWVTDPSRKKEPKLNSFSFLLLKPPSVRGPPTFLSAMSTTTEPSSSASTSAGPTLPPQKSVEDHFADAPLFMTSLPEEEGDNDAISALQALVFDETPDEVARNFKNQGNEYYAGRRFREAQGFYTQAIDAKPLDNDLLEVLLVNRAACNLALENNRQVLLDCAQALSLNPLSVKAHYRTSLAQLALAHYEEAIVSCDRALALPGQAGARSHTLVREKAVERWEKLKKKEGETKERERRKGEEAKALEKALRFRGIIIKKSSSPPDNPHPLHFDPETRPENSLDSIVPLWPLELSSLWLPPPPQTPLILPTFLLYPSHQTSDLLSHLPSTTPLLQALSPLFPPLSPPPEWDSKGEFTIKNIAVYVETSQGRLLKIPVGPKKGFTMEDVFQAGRKDAAENGGERDGVVVRDGVVSLVVVTKGEGEEKWVGEMKRRREGRQ
ncbi:hypothetical protein BDY24DRAFT_381927 [Mrakia frigida]|uniref:uncharacterized protein n=1 Tax=Mrakia frigida TaxID=29902 RepID=UPI003FCC16A1